MPPDWFGREVTEDAKLSYGILAREDGMMIGWGAGNDGKYGEIISENNGNN